MFRPSSGGLPYIHIPVRRTYGLYFAKIQPKNATKSTTSGCMHTGKNSGTSRRKLHNDTSNFEGYALVLATQIYTKILLGLYFRDNGTVDFIHTCSLRWVSRHRRGRRQDTADRRSPPRRACAGKGPAGRRGGRGGGAYHEHATPSLRLTSYSM